MSLPEIYQSARGMEAVENYAQADAPLRVDSSAMSAATERDEAHFIIADSQFWDMVSGRGWGRAQQSAEDWFGATFTILRAAVSEWVARVPGLFWLPEAQAMRELSSTAAEFTSGEWMSPISESGIVSGGIGTIRLAPNERGYRLISLCPGVNASAGIPALVSPEVWEHPGLRRERVKHLCEGSVLNGIHARWERMPGEWATFFDPGTRIPRGCLVLNQPESVADISTWRTATIFHPCTVMEHQADGALLWDFVFAEVDTRVEGYRAKVEEFFRVYKTLDGRQGRYLFPADPGDPWWEAEFSSPAELRQMRFGRTQLDLLRSRVYGQRFDGHTIDDLIRLLTYTCTLDDQRRIAAFLDLHVTLTSRQGSPAEFAVEMVHECVRRQEEGKVHGLVAALVEHAPGAMTR